MPRQTLRTWALGLIVTAAAVALFTTIWLAAPDDLRGGLLFAAAVLTIAGYAVLYVIQRKRHW